MPSATGGPPTGPPMGADLGKLGLGPPAMMRSASNTSAASAGGGGPPTRPGTSMSNASSIDDLLGPVGPRVKGAGKKKKGGRYVDVMAQGT